MEERIKEVVDALENLGFTRVQAVPQAVLAQHGDFSERNHFTWEIEALFPSWPVETAVADFIGRQLTTPERKAKASIARLDDGGVWVTVQFAERH